MELENFILKFRKKNYNVKVPFSMYSALIESGDLKHPYYEGSEKKARDLSNEDIECVCRFDSDKDIICREHIILNFYGIDTLSEITLNGVLLGKTENMHLKYSFDIKNIVQLKDNLLSVKIFSPIKYIAKKQKQYPLSGFNDWALGFAHLRKSNCSFGWDWGPQLPDMGIFRKVEIECWDKVKLDQTNVKQTHSNGQVKLDFESEIFSCADYVYKVAVVSPKGEKFEAVSQNRNSLEIVIGNPLLWWPNNLGGQPLYDVRITVSANGEICEKNFKIGLREFTVLNEKDSRGREFTFRINGIKFFAMGGNYIPEDAILPQCTNERTSRLLSDLKKANFNTVRVWGGGYYPNDFFYDECDRLGLIVWQDFMFACTTVYFDESVKENLGKEFAYNIKRIRNHPCLGLLCGNNEIELLFADWTYLPRTKLDEEMYLELFENFLPSLCSEYAPEVFYIPSSPTSGGRFNRPNDVDCGDSHFWDVWHGLKPFEEYGKHLFRFCSEFGFESFPDLKTIKTYAKGGQLNPFSEKMENHQKCKDGNMRIMFHSSQNYKYPTSIENFIYVSQLIQADAIKYGVEHMRANRGICMGAIYWQINDCWPVSSWSSIDYFGRWKALQYAAKKFYAPILLSLCSDNGEITAHICNETKEVFNGILEYAVCDNKNNVIKKRTLPVSAEPFSVLHTGIFERSEETKKYYFAAKLVGEDKTNLYASSLFTKPKYFDFKKPAFDFEFEKTDGKTFLCISSDVYAKSVKIDFEDCDFVLSDNYFDLSAIKPRTKIEIENCGTDIKELAEKIRVKSAYDIS